MLYGVNYYCLNIAFMLHEVPTFCELAPAKSQTFFEPHVAGTTRYLQFESSHVSESRMARVFWDAAAVLNALVCVVFAALASSV